MKKEQYIKKFSIFVEGKKNKPNYKTINIDGFVVYQGRDAESNDYLTFEVASNDDYWLHAKGVPGSHVIIKVAEKVPDERLIYKVAEIAAKNSAASKKNLEHVNVICCKRMFVTKKPGMNPGQVSVEELNSQIIKVKM